MFLMSWLGCGAGSPARVEAPEDRAPGLPLVVAIHGYGSRPENVRTLVEGCGLAVDLVTPAGPLSVGSGPDAGHSWFAVGGGPDGARFQPEEIGRAADRLAGVIEKLKRDRPTAGPVVLTGFSQGGILSFAVALRHPETVSTAIPLAGGLPETLVPSPLPSDGPPIHALHGDRDDVIPVGPTRTLVEQLAAAGRTADLTVFPDTAHTVSPEMHAVFCRTLAAAIAPASP